MECLLQNPCYTLTFINTSWTDRRPEFTVNMTFTQQGSVRSLTWLQNDINSPVAKLKILQKGENNKISVLYSVTARLCELKQFFEKIPMFKSSFQVATKQGNYTFSCPLKQGFYVMENIRIPHRSPALQFMYRTKTTFTFIGGLYEELSDKSILPLTTYEFGIKIMKKLC